MHISMNSGSSSSQDDKILRAFSCKSRNQIDHNNGIYSQDKKVSSASDDREIGVFAAEKYFSGEIDTQRSTAMIDQKISGHSTELTISSDPTASVASGTSLHNSRSSLLQNTAASKKHDSSTHHNTGQTKSKTFLSNLSFKCRCSCLDENSASIDHEVIETRPRAFSSFPHRSVPSPADEVVSFPTTRTLPRTLIRELEEIPRESIEVFGSPVLQKRNRSSIKPKTLQQSHIPRESELFEIGSFTGKAKAETFLARQGSGVESPPHPPSEASVQWSVVTASAADFSVASSDHSETLRPVSIGSPVYKHILTSKAEIETKPPSSVLSCRADRRSPGVAGDSYRIVSPRLDLDFLRGDCNTSLERKERLGAESERKGLESRSAGPRFFTPNSASPHTSRRMFIQ